MSSDWPIPPLCLTSFPKQLTHCHSRKVNFVKGEALHFQRQENIHKATVSLKKPSICGDLIIELMYHCRSMMELEFCRCREFYLFLVFSSVCYQSCSRCVLCSSYCKQVLFGVVCPLNCLLISPKCNRTSRITICYVSSRSFLNILCYQLVYIQCFSK